MKRQLMRRQRRKALRYHCRIMVKLKEETRVFYMSSDQPQSTNMMEPLMVAAVVDSQVSKPQHLFEHVDALLVSGFGWDSISVCVEIVFI